MGGWPCHRVPKNAKFWGAVPLWENLVFAHRRLLLLLLQVGTSCEAKSQNSDESCQKISPLQRKQGKTTSWWGFPGEGKVKPSLLPSMCCLKMAVLQRENIFFPPSKGVCGVNDRACALSTRTQIGLRRGYECYFHRSF